MKHLAHGLLDFLHNIVFCTVLFLLSSLGFAQSLSNTNTSKDIVALTPSVAQLLVDAGVKDRLRLIPDAHYDNAYLQSLEKQDEVYKNTNLNHLKEKYHLSVHTIFVGTAEFAEEMQGKEENVFLDVPYGTVDQLSGTIQFLNKKFNGNPWVMMRSIHQIQSTLRDNCCVNAVMRPAFVMVLDKAPNGDIYVAGQHTFSQEIFSLAGARNVVSQPGWVKLSSHQFNRLPHYDFVLDVTPKGLEKFSKTSTPIIRLDPDLYTRYSSALVIEGLPEARKIIEAQIKKREE